MTTLSRPRDLTIPALGPSRRLGRGAQLGAAAAGVVLAVLLLLVVGALRPAPAAVLGALFAVVAVTTTTWVVEGRRKAVDRLATAALTGAFVVALIPLVAVFGYTLVKGLGRFDGEFLLHSMNNVAESDPGGGAYHAIVGTLEQVGITALIAVPLGLLTAVFITEYAGSRVSTGLRVTVDVMMGVPSIVAGLFVFALWILLLGQPYSGFAGSLALTILMLPTVIRSTEEMLKLVPQSLREASFALGVPKWVTITRVVLPTAAPGIVTGVLLGIARVMGETAPVLLTVFGFQAINFNPLSGPQASLPLFVFLEAGLPNETAVARAWAGALTLIVLIMLLNLVGRLFSRFSSLSR